MLDDTPVPKPKVSIVIPVYNGVNFLGAAIDSALAQTYENVEVIVINDGSTDGGGTEQLALSYGDRIRYFRKENGGVASALNLGIREMTGEYFSWLSHDDLYHPEKIGRLLSFQQQFDGRVVVLCDSMLVNEHAEPLRLVAVPESLEKEPALLAISSTIDGCALLVKKTVIDEIGLFDENLRTTQDIELWFRMARCGYRFERLREALSFSRVHGAQTTYRVSDRHKEECRAFFLRIAAELQPSWLAKNISQLSAILTGKGQLEALQTVLWRCHEHLPRLVRLRIIAGYHLANSFRLMKSWLRKMLRGSWS